ncbi:MULTISPECIES: hypothetical protein [unclassified Sphingomonas]|uniref:hypothetical protein n=1 Tax=unclassified Sphingomonas TaxID=196159 RepID=UPI00226AE1C0|nr:MULTISPECIES: hypothetical protein [unclassified Sphingomonas]
MVMRSVGFQLRSEGKAEVKNDFAEVQTAGETAMAGIATAAENAGERSARSIEALADRQAKANAKLAALAQGTGLNTPAPQQYTAPGQAAADMAALKAAAALKAELDPLWAAAQTLNRELERLAAIERLGVLSADELAAAHARAHSAFEASTTGAGKVTNSAGAMRAAMQGASYQIQDLFTQISMGTNPLQALAVQGGQLAGQFANIENKAGAVARFMIGPWGLAITGAMLVLAPLVGKILDFSDATEGAIDKMRKDAAETENNRLAKLAFTRTAEGVSAAIRDNTEATKKSIEVQRTAAEQNNINSQQNLRDQVAIRAKTAALLEQAEAEYKASTSILNQSGGAAQMVYAKQLGDAQKAAEKARTDLKAAQTDLERSRIALAADQAKADSKLRSDPNARINKFYDDQVVALNKSKEAAIARGETIGAISKREYADIERNRQAALKAEQDRESAARKSQNQTQNQIGRNVTLSEARSIAEGVGGRVTSDHRSTAEQAVLYAKYKAGTGNLAAKPGTSYHELDQALDVAKGNGITLAKLVAAYRQAGVKLVEALHEGDHYHVAWKKTGAEAQAATQERQDAAKQAREAAAANRELDQDLKQVVATYDPARAGAEAYADALARINTLVAAGRLSRADASAYRAVADQNERARLAKEQLAKFQSLFGSDDPLKGAVDEATDGFATRNNAKLQAVARDLDELRGYGSDFVDTVLNEDTWTSWGNAGKTILNSLKSEFIKLALLNPLKNLINGNSNLPTLTSAIGNIGKLFGGGVGKNATGTESWSGGMTWVNENGPEIADLPNGTRIYPAAETRRMLAANENSGGGRVKVDIGLNTDLFTATVAGTADQRIGAAAPNIAAGGAQMGKMEMAKARRRQLGRRG